MCRSFDEGGRGVGAERRKRDREMLPTVAVGWRALPLRDEEAGRFREVVGVFNSRQPNKLAIDREMFSGCVDAGLICSCAAIQLRRP